MREAKERGVYEQVGVAMTCRSFREYVDMFGLSEDDISRGPVLDVGAGASSFTAELAQRGVQAAAVDPLYETSSDALYRKGKQEIVESTAKLAAITDTLQWEYYGSIEQHQRNREKALEQFIRAYRTDEQKKARYVCGMLPNLPFADDQFALVLGSHFLFLYHEQFDETFHLEAIQEMLRVCKPAGQIRLYPLIGLDRKPYAGMGKLLAHIEGQGHEARLQPTGFRFWAGATHYLQIKK